MTESKLRAGLIASVKIAQKDLGLDDTTYRSLLQAVTGMDSAARCTVPQLKAMLAELRAKGWTPRPRNVPQELQDHGPVRLAGAPPVLCGCHHPPPDTEHGQPAHGQPRPADGLRGGPGSPAGAGGCIGQSKMQ